MSLRGTKRQWSVFRESVCLSVCVCLCLCVYLSLCECTACVCVCYAAALSAVQWAEGRLRETDRASLLRSTLYTTTRPSPSPPTRCL